MKVRNIYLLVSCVLGATTLSSCGDFKTKKKGRKVSQNESELSADWRSECTAIDWAGMIRNKEQLRFSSVGDFDRQVTVFKDANCTAPAAELITRGTYDVIGTSSEPANAKDINFTVADAAIKLKDKGTVDQFNQAKFCGRTDWALDQERSILDQTCEDKVYRRGQVIFDIYDRDGDKLFFGKQGGLLFTKADPAFRPKSLDTSHLLTRR